MPSHHVLIDENGTDDALRDVEVVRSGVLGISRANPRMHVVK